MTERDAEAKLATTKIRNATRTTLTFQVPGRSIRLMPGKTTDVPRAYLETVELQVLCRQGAVHLVEPERPARRVGEAAEEEKGPASEHGRRSATRRR